MKNNDIHQKCNFLKNMIFLAIEHLYKEFLNDLAEFVCR